MTRARQILGIRFFNGDVDEAVQSMVQRGGFLIAPSGTCFARLREDERYRRAVLAADLAIADSGLMVVLCRLFRRQTGCLCHRLPIDAIPYRSGRAQGWLRALHYRQGETFFVW